MPSSTEAGPEVVAEAPKNIGWSALRSTAAQIVGRLAITLTRFLIAGLIVRTFGGEMYGEYSTLLLITVIAEWITDFGLNEIIVREMSREAESRARLMRILTAGRALLTVVGFAATIAIVWAMGYPDRMLHASLIAGVGVILQAGVLLYRAAFRTDLSMERDALAEAASVAVMIVLVWIACRTQAGLLALAGCHTASRAVYLLASWFLGRKRAPVSLRGIEKGEVRRHLLQALPLGISGLLVVLYDSLDPLILSRIESLHAAGVYNVALRFVWLMAVLVSALGITLYPILSMHWARRMDEFRKSLQIGLDAVVLIAGVLFCGLYGAAEFLMRMISPEMVPGAPLLRILAAAFFAKSITSTIGPALYVVGAQRRVLWLTSAGVLVKAVLLLIFINRFGTVGAVWSVLAVECFCGLVPTILLVQNTSGYRFRWAVLVKVVAISAAVLVLLQVLGILGTFLGGALAAALYVILCLATGAVSRVQVGQLVTAVRSRFAARRRVGQNGA